MNVYLCSNWSWSWRKAKSYCSQSMHVSVAFCQHWIHLARAESSPMFRHWSVAWMVSVHSWIWHWRWMRDVILCGVSMTLNTVRSPTGWHLSPANYRLNRSKQPAWKIRKLDLIFNRLECHFGLLLVDFSYVLMLFSWLLVHKILW